MRIVIVACALASGVAAAQVSTPPAPSRVGTQIVMLGTGTPRPDPERAGPATAIVVNGASYLVDVGPGIVRRATAARAKGIEALAPAKLLTAFVTHLHSDHTVGYPDLIFTPWVQGRREPLRVFGPVGLESMTKYILLAWQADVDIRSKRLEQRRADVLVEAHDVKPGVVFKDANVTVTAFQNAHGEWPQSFGCGAGADDENAAAIARGYAGRVAIARDLDVY